MASRDLSKFFDDDVLEYPAVPSKVHPDGKTYKVASPDATTGLWLTVSADVALKAVNGGPLTPQDIGRLTLADDEERTLYQRVLGETYDELVADGVKWTMLQHIGQDAYLCFSMSQEVADAALALLGEALARGNRATRRTTKRTAKKTAGPKSKTASTATRARTRSRASTPSSTSPSGPAGEAQTV